MCADGRGLTRVEGVRLQAVDHVVVGLQQHEVLGRVSVPDEDVATVGAAHHKVVAPETGFFNLEVAKKKKKQKTAQSHDAVGRSVLTQLFNFSNFKHRNQRAPYYHGPGIAVAFVDHLDRGSPDILSLALLHLPPLFPPAEQLLDACGCRAPEAQKEKVLCEK